MQKKKFLTCTLLVKMCDPGPQNQSYVSILEFEIYTSSESWINKLSIDVWFVRIGQYSAAVFETISFSCCPKEGLSNAYY